MPDVSILMSATGRAETKSRLMSINVLARRIRRTCNIFRADIEMAWVLRRGRPGFPPAPFLRLVSQCCPDS